MAYHPIEEINTRNEKIVRVDLTESGVCRIATDNLEYVLRGYTGDEICRDISFTFYDMERRKCDIPTGARLASVIEIEKRSPFFEIYCSRDPNGKVIYFGTDSIDFYLVAENHHGSIGNCVYVLEIYLTH